jgi:hypothetical protein
MMEILRKHGFPAGIATLVVLAITFVPVYYQYKYTREQNARIEVLEAKVASLEKK